jgi:hypothetical protein
MNAPQQQKIINKVPGIATKGTVQSIVSSSQVMVSLDTTGVKVKASYYPAYNGANGHFIGGQMQEGTPVLVLQGDGGLYYIIAILLSPYQTISFDGDELIVSSDQYNTVRLDPDTYTTIGDQVNSLRVDAKRGILSNNFGGNYSFNDASIQVDGIVRRDMFPNLNDFSVRRDGHEFDDDLKEICFDPSSIPSLTTSSSAVRNPQFVEKRELVYEFAHSTFFSTDAQEIQIIQNGQLPEDEYFYNRREARTDLLSLTQFEPNYLMETVKGTVVDIYGNILDLNRNILPAGKEKNLSFITNTDKEDAYVRIREAERKSIAYHFEINARKGNPPDSQGNQPKNPTLPPLPDITTNKGFARDRSQFFFDVDKEGQFKFNVPASSEKGNIPLTVRATNSSTISAVQNSDDVNQFTFDGQPSENRFQRRDLYLDTIAFNGGSISINDPDNTTGFATPMDRLSNQPIKHGTIYHDITQICAAQRSPVTYEYQPVNTQISTITYPTTFVSTAINVSGTSANAGGRSGQLTFDGMIEMNVGANTIDKQSIWLDTQGSLLGQIGRDLNGISVGLSLTGDLLVTIGGPDAGMAPSGPMTNNISDPRFVSKGANLAMRPGTVDFRIYQQTGEFAVVRVDQFGLTFLTPTNISMVAGQDLMLKAGGQVCIDAEEIVFYSNDTNALRVVQRSGSSIL